jgi:hypothetical protein
VNAINKKVFSYFNTFFLNRPAGRIFHGGTLSSLTVSSLMVRIKIRNYRTVFITFFASECYACTTLDTIYVSRKRNKTKNPTNVKFISDVILVAL